MALVYDHTFTSYSELTSIPALVNVGSWTGYSGVTVTSMVVKIRKGLLAGTRLVKIGVYTDEGVTLAYSTEETVSFTSLEVKEITLTFPSTPTAHIWAGGYIRFYLIAAAGTGSTATWCSDGDEWLQINGTLIEESGDGVSKPTTPTPTNASGPGVDFSAWTLAWVDGGTTETYDVFMGTSAYTLNRVVEGTTNTTVTLAVGNRPAVTGGIIYWRVDAIVGEDRATGDVWYFDPRPAQVSLTSPTDAAIDQSLQVAMVWAAAAATVTYSFNIIADGGGVTTTITGLTATTIANVGVYLTLSHSTKFLWSVDTVNTFGTTTGVVWDFTTAALEYVLPSWELIDGKTLGPLTGGTVGVDFRWLGYNNIVSIKHLVAAANNRIWYEDS
jgi:hypothetical protein